MSPDESPEERHRRRLAMFARWLTRYRQHDATTRKAIESLARSISEGGCHGKDRDAALDSLDELLDLL